MRKPVKQEIWQAFTCLLCVVVAWMRVDEFWASGFSGGRVTGPVLSIFDKGTLVFALAMILTFVYPRVAAASLSWALCSVCRSISTSRRQAPSVPFSPVNIRFRYRPASSGTHGQ